MQLPILKGSIWLLASSLLALASNGSYAVVNGEEVDPNSIPFQVSVTQVSVTPEKGHFCGGSILREHAVLTSAICVFGQLASQIDIVAGRHNLVKVNEGTEQRVTVSEIVIHKNFNPYISLEHDIAILFLVSNLDLSFDSIDKIPLPDSGQNFVPGNAVVSGWGTLSYGGSSPNELQEVTVPLVTDEQCRYGYGEQAITDNMLCADEGYGGACEGDGGGPLTCDGVLCGIVSWGIGCGHEAYPGVYTEVSKYRKWIDCVLHYNDETNRNNCDNNWEPPTN